MTRAPNYMKVKVCFFLFESRTVISETNMTQSEQNDSIHPWNSMSAPCMTGDQ